MQRWKSNPVLGEEMELEEIWRKGMGMACIGGMRHEVVWGVGWIVENKDQ
jgi:hypothetical protein